MAWSMEEEFEKWAETNARVWVDRLITLLREKGVVLDIKGLEYLLIKAFQAGYDYGKDNAKK